MKNRVIRESASDRFLSCFCYGFVILFSIIVILPFWTLMMDSLSGAQVKFGLRMWPEQFSLKGWKDVLTQRSLYVNFGNSVWATGMGTLLCVMVSFLTAYPLSKGCLPFNRTLTYLMLFTMYFGGGLIPRYLLYKDLGLIDNRWVLVLPSAFSAYYTLVLRNFLSDIPVELEESAKLDGANDLIIAFRIYLPLAKPIIATVALWSAVAHWNSWFGAMIYIVDPNKQVLQVMLRRMLMEAQTAAMFDDGVLEVSVSTDAVKAVTILFTIFPIVCTYPFAQKYFIRGLTSGAVKG